MSVCIYVDFNSNVNCYKINMPLYGQHLIMVQGEPVIGGVLLFTPSTYTVELVML